MSDPVEDFLAREKDGLAGLEGEIPQAFQGESKYLIKFLDLILLILENGDDSFGSNHQMDSFSDGKDQPVHFPLLIFYR